ncbi:MAG: hypothetical protein RL060_248 [Bacteroidota bacterium]|jgi:uncharacterized protein (DUF58 family)
MKEILKKIKKFEVKIRTAINTKMHGDFHSIFKGSGIEFDDVRAYQYGDDVRSIDWNVSAKGHGTFIKTFHEDKEQHVYFIVDVSASQHIGKQGVQKIDLAREIASILALSASKEASLVSLVCFSDQKEKYIKPGRGLKHIYSIISTLYELEAKSTKTNLNAAINFAANVIKKKSVVILLSDFIDENYENNLRALARKHDLVVIQLTDRRESVLPRLGIIPIFDKEQKKTIWINTSSFGFRKRTKAKFAATKEAIESICKQNKANYLQVLTHEDYLAGLIKLFKTRQSK